MVEYFQTIIGKSKIAIFRGGLDYDNPHTVLNDAVKTQFTDCYINEFIESDLCNPYVRVIVEEINDLPYIELKEINESIFEKYKDHKSVIAIVDSACFAWDIKRNIFPDKLTKESDCKVFDVNTMVFENEFSFEQFLQQHFIILHSLKEVDNRFILRFVDITKFI